MGQHYRILCGLLTWAGTTVLLDPLMWHERFARTRTNCTLTNGVNETRCIKDPFSYSARRDSLGLDCAYCVHVAGTLAITAGHTAQRSRSLKP